MTRYALALLAVLALAISGTARAQNVNDANEKAVKVVAGQVAPCVVKIETAGGLNAVGGGKKDGPIVRRGIGPTTGLIVSPDGYVISSAFNFANKPTDIFITIPGRPRQVAEVVATDLTRMVTLLKIKGDVKDLPVPTAFPKKDMKIGQWAVALGRTLDPNTDHPPSVSVGIISAVNRLWGKAIQTDAKISPVNYGGPLVAIDGRVLGVLIPADPETEDAVAGFEWYDSGIGFAIPLEDILAVLPRLKEKKDLRKGQLGITPQSAAAYTAEFVIGTVQPDSAAARAGLKSGDKIVAFDDKPVVNSSTFRHLIGPKYEGDKIKLKVKRADAEMEFPNITLLGTVTAYVNPFFGILPLRDDAQPGVQIRFVYPKSPADTAGLKEGDRIMKAARADAKALTPVRDRKHFTTLISVLPPGTEVKVEVKRKEGEKVETVSVKLTTVPDQLPEKLSMPSSAGKALETMPKKGPDKEPDGNAPEETDSCQEPKKDDSKKKDGEKIETGFLERRDETLGREYWLFIPDNYDPNVSHGLIVWFHPTGQGGKDGERMFKTFREFCETSHFIVMGPKSKDQERWAPGEAELVLRDVNAVLGQYTIDRSRVVAHGMGTGGQMAFHMGFHARDVFRGVATVGSMLGTPPKDNAANQPLSFFIAAGDKDPVIKEIQASKAVLEEKRFPVVYREIKETGKEYFDLKTFNDLLVWLDSLDRI